MKKLVLTLFAICSFIVAGAASAQEPVPSGKHTKPGVPVQSKQQEPPLRRWGLSFLSGGGVDGYSAYAGFGIALSYQFNAYLGVEAAFEHYTYTSRDPEHQNPLLMRPSVSALWFFMGQKRDGLNIYVKGGWAYQIFNAEYRNSASEESVTGGALQVGTGFQWRFLDGRLSFGVEALAITPSWGTDEGGDALRSGSLNIRTTLSGHNTYGSTIALILFALVAGAMGGG